MRDIPAVEIQEVRRAMVGLQQSEVLAVQVRVPRFARTVREQKCQIGVVRVHEP